MGEAFLYGSGGSNKTGATLTVTAPAGCTVTVSKDGKSKTKVSASSGMAVFKGLSSGEWTIAITDGEQTAQKTVTITADYETAITFFSATIHVTYPAGSTCTATDGVTTLTAPDTSGTWECGVPNAGTWTVSLDSGFSEAVTIATEGETKTLNKWYLFNNGDQHTALTGGWTKNANYKQSTYNNTGTVTIGKTIYVESTGGISAVASTVNKILVGNFVKLCGEVESFGGEQSKSILLSLMASNSGNISADYAAIIYMEQTGVSELDISAVSGEMYLTVGVHNRRSGTVTKIWMEA